MHPHAQPLGDGPAAGGFFFGADVGGFHPLESRSLQRRQGAFGDFFDDHGLPQTSPEAGGGRRCGVQGGAQGEEGRAVDELAPIQWQQHAP